MRNFPSLTTPLKTPMKTPQRRTPRLPTDEEAFRQLYFLRPVKDLIDNAMSGGYLLDWGNNVDLECPQPFFWPAETDEKGQECPIDVSCFNDAFQIYDFDIPLCACNTQDKTSDLAKRQRMYTFNIFVCRNSSSAYFGNVILTCRKQRAGCDAFVVLDEFATQGNLVLKEYPRRAIRRKGIPNFDLAGILSAPSPSSTLSARERTLDATMSPLTRFRQTSASKELSSRPLSNHVRQNSEKCRHSASLETQRNGPTGAKEGPAVTDTMSSDDDEDVFLSGPTRLQQTQSNRRHNSVSTASPPRYASIDPAYRSPSHPIIDRYYGETAMLSDLPDADEVLTRNRDLPALRGEELQDSMKDLDTIRGIPSSQFWRTIDMCECERWFTKRALHDEHRKICPYWASIPEPVQTPSHNTVSSGSIERLITVRSPETPSLCSPIQHESQPSPPGSVGPFRQRPTTLFGRQLHHRLSQVPSTSPYGKPLPLALRIKNKGRATDSGSNSSWMLEQPITPQKISKAFSDSNQSGHVMMTTSTPRMSSAISSSQHEGPLPSVLVQEEERRSPYPTGPHPSPISPPTHPVERPEDVSPTRTPSDVSSFNTSCSDVSYTTSQDSNDMHTIHEDVLNAFLDTMAFDTLNAGRVPDSNN